MRHSGRLLRTNAAIALYGGEDVGPQLLGPNPRKSLQFTTALRRYTSGLDPLPHGRLRHAHPFGEMDLRRRIE